METKGSLPCSQESSVCPYDKSHQSNPDHLSIHIFVLCMHKEVLHLLTNQTVCSEMKIVSFVSIQGLRQNVQVSYFMTGGLQPIRSSWHHAPQGS
jgi:hypothetical protein